MGLFLFECQNCPLTLQLKYNILYFFLFSNEPVTWNFSTTVYGILFFYMDYWSRVFFFEILWWHFVYDAYFVEVLLMKNLHNRNITQNYLSLWDREDKWESLMLQHRNDMNIWLLILQYQVPRAWWNIKNMFCTNTLSIILDY